jgi:hypothetical protein
MAQARRSVHPKPIPRRKTQAMILAFSLLTSVAKERLEALARVVLKATT